MKVADVYKLTIRVLKKEYKEHPNRSYTSKEGDTVTLKDLIDKLELVLKWIYPGLYMEDVATVVRCKKCKYYRTYRKKGALKATTFKACCKDMNRRDPMFFCAHGEREE